MNEIKFRCWDILRKEMKDVGSLTISKGVTQTIIAHFRDILGFDYDIVDGESGNIMQFTGLLDKNGKEIYESDIVKIGKDLIEEVKWIDQISWRAEKCPVNGFVNHESIYKEKPEIIGNVYENPDLLNN